MAQNIEASKRIIYANEAFQALQSFKGLSSTVYRDYESLNAQNGDTVTIDVPSVFTAGAVASGADKQDLVTGKIDVKLNEWNGVAFKVTDRDLTQISPQFMQNHLFPAVNALAEKIEQDLFGLVKFVPWFRNKQGSDAPVDDLIAIRKILKGNKVPNDNQSYLGMSAERYAAYLGTPQASNANQSGLGGQPQVDGIIQRQFGLNLWETQLAPSLTAGALVGTPRVKSNTSKGATAITFDAATTLTGTLNAGDTFTIAGQTQRYAVRANATAAGDEITVEITPALVANVSATAAVTVNQEATNIENSIAYHRTAFALVMRPLPQVPNSTVISDPSTGLSMRLNAWYNDDDAAHWMRIDALYGVKELDVNRAVRYRSV
jgi:hypothetical protein